MDTSKKTLKNKRCCNFCIHYQPTRSHGKKMSYGVCRVTGKEKYRTDSCLKNFNDKNQLSWI